MSARGKSLPKRALVRSSQSWRNRTILHHARAVRFPLRTISIHLVSWGMKPFDPTTPQ